MESTVVQQVRQLYEVEGLTLRQIAQKLQVSRKKVSRVIRAQSLKKAVRENLCQPYERLIRQWYEEYPFLKLPCRHVGTNKHENFLSYRSSQSSISIEAANETMWKKVDAYWWYKPRS